MSNIVKIILIIMSLFWNYLFSLLVLWLFIIIGIIQFKVRVFDAEIFAYTNCIMLFFINYPLFYIEKISKKKIIFLSIGYIIFLVVGFSIFSDFRIKTRYIPLIYAYLSVFIFNSFCLLIIWRLCRKMLRIFK